MAPLIQGGRIEEFAACYHKDQWKQEETRPKNGPPVLPSVYVKIADESDCIPNLDVGMKLQRWSRSESDLLWPAFPLTFGLGDHQSEASVRFALLECILNRLIVGPLRVLRDSLESLRYVGPMRNIPARVFEPTKSPDPGRWAAGLAAWDELHTASELFVDEVSQWLESPDYLDTGYRLARQVYRELDVSSRLYRALIVFWFSRNWRNRIAALSAPRCSEHHAKRHG